jgi:hypothetical protein
LRVFSGPGGFPFRHFLDIGERLAHREGANRNEELKLTSFNAVLVENFNPPPAIKSEPFVADRLLLQQKLDEETASAAS